MGEDDFVNPESKAPYIFSTGYWLTDPSKSFSSRVTISHTYREGSHGSPLVVGYADGHQVQR